MVPVVGSGWPCTSAWYTFSTVRSLNARLSTVYACSLFATTMSPEVPTSSRCTIPCRSAAPDVEMRYPAATRAPTTVGPLHPGDGCAATPTGLSMTTTSSSSYTMTMPGTGSATTSMLAAGATSGIATSSHPPAASRSDLPSSLPSRCTPPAAAISAARVRDSPSSLDRAASTRSPTSPSGTGIARVSGILLGRAAGILSGVGASCLGVAQRVRGVVGVLRLTSAVEVDAGRCEEHDHDGRDDDRDVGDVADEDVPVGDEVHHLAARERRLAEQPVHEVAERPTEQEAEGDGPAQRPDPAARADDEHDDADGHQRQQPGHPGADGQCRPGVEHQLQAEQVTDQDAADALLEVVERPHLRQLVQDQDDGGDHEEQDQQPAPARARRGRDGTFVRGGGHRRSLRARQRR